MNCSNCFSGNAVFVAKTNTHVIFEHLPYLCADCASKADVHLLNKYYTEISHDSASAKVKISIE